MEVPSPAPGPGAPALPACGGGARPASRGTCPPAAPSECGSLHNGRECRVQGEWLDPEMEEALVARWGWVGEALLWDRPAWAGVHGPSACWLPDRLTGWSTGW